MTSFNNLLMSRAGSTSVKFFELGICTPGGVFLGVWYARGIDVRHIRTPSLVPKISGMRKQTSKYARVYTDY